MKTFRVTFEHPVPSLLIEGEGAIFENGQCVIVWTHKHQDGTEWKATHTYDSYSDFIKTADTNYYFYKKSLVIRFDPPFDVKESPIMFRAVCEHMRRGTEYVVSHSSLVELVKNVKSKYKDPADFISYIYIYAVWSDGFEVLLPGMFYTQRSIVWKAEAVDFVLTRMKNVLIGAGAKSFHKIVGSVRCRFEDPFETQVADYMKSGNVEWRDDYDIDRISKKILRSRMSKYVTQDKDTDE